MNSAGTDEVLGDAQHAEVSAQAQEETIGARPRRLCIALSAAPVLGCAFIAFRYVYNAPYWDEWLYTQPIARAFEGRLTPADFWVRVNEHVQLVSSVLVIPLARLTHWDMRYEVAVTWLFFVATFGLLAGQLFRVDRDDGKRGSLWAMPAMAMLLFSASQYAVWNWGLHVSIGAAVFFLVATLRLLTGPEVANVRVVSAMVMGWAATFSVGGGLSVWPAGLLAIVSRRDFPMQRRAALAGAWLAAGACACAVYVFSGSTIPPNAGEHVKRLDDIAVYVLAYLGGPISPYSGAMAVTPGLVLLAIAVLRLLRAKFDRFDAFVFGLVSVSVTVGLLTALKHAHEGVGNAVSSRFLPWPSLSWSAVAIALYRNAAVLRAAPRSMLAGVIVAGISVAAGWGYGAYRADERYDAFVLGRRALIENPDSADLRYLHPDPGVVQALRPKLEEHGLTVFRDAR